MNREELRRQQWTLWRERLESQPTHSSAWHCGFNAGWDALMAEIRPLVADLQSLALSESGSGTGMWHFNAVERLRELAREGE